MAINRVASYYLLDRASELRGAVARRRGWVRRCLAEHLRDRCKVHVDTEGVIDRIVIPAQAIGRKLHAAGQTRAENEVPLAGLAVACGAMIWLGLRAPVLTLLETELVLIIAGIGSGMQFPITTVSVQNAVDPRDMGVATGVLAFLRSLGSSIGVAVVGAVGSAAGIAAGLAGGGAASPHTPGSAFTPVFFAASISLALAFAMLTLMPELPLRGRTASAPVAAEA